MQRTCDSSFGILSKVKEECFKRNLSFDNERFCSLKKNDSLSAKFLDSEVLNYASPFIFLLRKFHVWISNAKENNGVCQNSHFE